MVPTVCVDLCACRPQPYAFTTKSLYVGHMDYKYLRWQVIDTPGILDRPLEERNTIEMQVRGQGSGSVEDRVRAVYETAGSATEQLGYRQLSYHSLHPMQARCLSRNARLYLADMNKSECSFPGRLTCVCVCVCCSPSQR